MQIFKKRKEFTPEKYGQFLGEQFIKKMNGFLHCNDFKDIVIQFKINNIKKFKQEWLLFNMFIMMQSLGSFYKNNKIKNKIINAFHDSCAELFLMIGSVSTRNEFKKMYISRYIDYSDAIQKNDDPGPLHWISKVAINNFTDEVNDIPNLIFIANYFNEEANSNIIFFNALKKEIKITI